jgi:hypothetical protein
VELLGSIRLVRAPRPGEDGRVRGQPLAGRAAREEPEQQREVGERGYDPLDAHERHVHPRQRAHEPPVPLVRDEADGPGLGDAEVDAGDADVGGEKHLSQLAARGLREVIEAFADGRALDEREEVRDVPGRLLDRRRDDMDGVFAGKLEDVLAEVCLDCPDPARVERLVEADLLGEHRLRLGDQAGLGRPTDLHDLGARVLGRRAAVHAASARLDGRRERSKVALEIIHRARPDLPRPVTQRLDVVELAPSAFTGGESRYAAASTAASTRSSASFSRAVARKRRRGCESELSRRLRVQGPWRGASPADLPSVPTGRGDASGSPGRR